MERHIGAAGATALLKKVGADQLLFAPSFIVVLLSTIGFTQGLNPKQIRDQLVATYPDILISNYKVSIVYVHLVCMRLTNFHFISIFLKDEFSVRPIQM